MNGLGLSAEALEMRRRYVQAGDAARIMAGEWGAVWREKKGLVQGDDLSNELRVQMGLFTEPFNLAWCEKVTGRKIVYYSDSPALGAAWRSIMSHGPGDLSRFVHSELVVSKEHPFMACNLDGMTTTPTGEPCPIDAKHVGRSDDPMILRYTAAGVHQATVMGCDWWALSIFVGNGKHEVQYHEVDPLYRAQLIVKEREFWGYVERNEEPPDDTARVLPPKPAPKLRTIIVPTEGPVLDAMVRENNWLGDAIPEMQAFISTDAAAKRNGIARSKLRDDLIPADIGDLTYGRFKAKRSKAGAVTMVVEPMEDDDAP